MRLVPPLRTVALAETIPGELVRMRLANQNAIGLMARDGYLSPCVLLFIKPGRAPLVRSISSSIKGEFALSYGHDYAFHVPFDSRFVTPFEQDFQINGGMIISQDRATIRVLADLPGMNDCFYNIGTGDLLLNEEPIVERWVSLDWEVRLSLQSADDPALFSFNAP